MPRDFYEATMGAPNVDGLFEVMSGIRITLYDRGTTTLATVFQRETGVTQGPSPEAGATGGPNPFTTGASGSVQFWSDIGRRDIKVEDTQVPARIATRTIQWNAIPLDGIPGANLADLGVVTAKLADSAVTNLKMADNAIATAELAALAVTAAKIETQQAWQTLPLAGGWTGTASLWYRKDSLGFVHTAFLAGASSTAITGGSGIAVDVLLATLPSGFRPDAFLQGLITDYDTGAILGHADFLTGGGQVFNKIALPINKSVSLVCMPFKGV